MSVFTELTPQDIQTILAGYALGELLAHEPVASGTDNTNYFINTRHGEHVLTLLERTDDAASDFAGALAQHLLDNGLPCAPPVRRRDGSTFTRFQGKRVVVAPRLAGASVMQPAATECAQAGEVLARLHIAAKAFNSERANPYGHAWLIDARRQLASVLTAAQKALFDAQLQALSQIGPVPAGQLIHGDLFRDNVLFNAGRISGIIDLYFAGSDHWLLDLAITVNDWCWQDGSFDQTRTSALLNAYHATRPINDSEYRHWPAMLRYAALRFWTSRLLDQHFARSGHETASKPAVEMETLLRYHQSHSPPPLP